MDPISSGASAEHQPRDQEDPDMEDAEGDHLSTNHNNIISGCH